MPVHEYVHIHRPMCPIKHPQKLTLPIAYSLSSDLICNLCPGHTYVRLRVHLLALTRVLAGFTSHQVALVMVEV